MKRNKYYSLLVVLVILLQFGLTASAQTFNKAATVDSIELTVQKTNRTTISKLKFNESGDVLASVDQSGFLVIRNTRNKINYYNELLKNKRISFIIFIKSKLYVLGDMGVEIFSLEKQNVVKENFIDIKNCYHIDTLDNFLYLLAENMGKSNIYIAPNKTGLAAIDFKIAFETKGDYYFFKIKHHVITLVGSNETCLINFNNKEIISKEKIPFNDGYYGFTYIPKDHLLIPAYSGFNTQVIDCYTGKAITANKTKYRFAFIDTVVGANLSAKEELGIKTAIAFDTTENTILIANRFTASAISNKAQMAFGDFYGNLYVCEKQPSIRVVETIVSNTNIPKIAKISNSGQLLAVTKYNTRTTSVMVINLQNGKIIYNYTTKRFEISDIKFDDNNNILIYYPDGGIDKITNLTSNEPIVTAIKKGVLAKHDGQNFQLLNFTIGASGSSSTLNEHSFKTATQKDGTYTLVQKIVDGYKVFYSKSKGTVVANKMPPIEIVEKLIEDADLTNDLKDYDQMEKDILVMNTTRFSETEFYAYCLRKNINTTKGLNLYKQAKQPSKEKIIVVSNLTNNILLSKSIVDECNYIQIDTLNNAIYVIGKQSLYKYEINNKNTSSVSIKKDTSAFSYNFNFACNKFISIESDNISIIDLNNLQPKAKVFLFDDGAFFYEGSFFYSTLKTPRIAYKYKKKYHSFEQLDAKYNRPDKVLEALGSTDKVLIQSYRNAYYKRIKKLNIDTTKFKDDYTAPIADLVNSDTIAYQQSNKYLTLHISAADSTYELDRFNILINQSPIFGKNGYKITQYHCKKFDTTITVALSMGENKIETTVTNSNGLQSYRSPIFVNIKPYTTDTITEKLHFIGIGIDKFEDTRFNLNWSTKDIRDLATKLKLKYKNNIRIDTLFNSSVTNNNIKSLKIGLLESGVNDKVIIAYSGHGLLNKNYDYFLSTYDINFNQPEQSGLPYDELESLLDSIPARKKLMLIDACHSGEVDKEEIQQYKSAQQKLDKTKGIIKYKFKSQGQLGVKNSFEVMQNLFVNLEESLGATIISAASGTQFALEKNSLKNGVFTYSILEYLNNHSTATINELKSYVNNRVAVLTNGLQQPTARKETMTNWILW